MKTTRIGILGICMAGLMSSAPAEAADLERGWTLVNEDLEVFLDPTAGTLVLEGVLTARLEHDDSSVGPVLALNSRSTLLRFEDVSADGAEVELNGVHPDLENALVTSLRFETPKKRGDEVEISFTCRSLEQGNQFVVSETVALASWVEAWYPILPPQEDVSLGGATKVPGRTVFHLPPGWHAVTNGALISSEETDSETIEIWETERALSRSFAAAPYSVFHQEFNGLDVSLYLLSKDLPSPDAHVEALGQAIAAMEEHWGPYPYPSYAIAEVPMEAGSFGASSEQGFIMVKPGFLRVPSGNLPLFAHEAAHAWWGNTVGTDGPGSLLCSESLAQYGAVIAAERVWGAKAATEFLRFSRAGYVSKQCARGYFEMSREGHDKPMAELVSGGHVDHNLSDAKGHWVYHMLRRRVGDERFFSTLRGLIRDYSGKLMTLDNVRASFVAAAPEAGLEKFFEQWLDRAGAPVLRHTWESTEDGIALTIEQLQDGEPYELRLDVAIESSERSPHLEQLLLTERTQTFQVQITTPVSRVRLDPNHALLIWDPELGESPVPGLEDVEPEPLSEEVIRTYTGEYDVAEMGIAVKLSGAEGRLMLALGDGEAEPLVRTGGHRFRSSNGYVLFDVDDEQAASLKFVRDGGGVRLAVRRD